jgi:hypothetical protein
MASVLESHCEQRDAPVHAAMDSADSSARYREALSLWLDWNRAYETVTAQMFDNRGDVAAMREMMDRMDEVRRRAVELSQALIVQK